MVRTSDISYGYKGQTVIKFPDMDIKVGEHTLILGGSGCGKTTLLQLLSGMRKPASGSIIVDGQDIIKMSSGDMDEFRGRHIGMIFQTPHFLRALTVKENLRVAQQLSGTPMSDQRITAILSELNIADKADKKTQALSVGEQQRVAIARALINTPKVIYADEPTSALDDDNTERVIQLLQTQAAASGATLCVVTHDKRLKDNFTNRIEL